MSNSLNPEDPDPSRSGDLTGKTIGRFAIRAKLGSGGMGEVYRAEDTKLKRSVAIKRVAPELASDEQYRRRILKEAERASRLSNPHLAQIFDVFEEGSGIFLVMEYIEGETLRERLRRPMSLTEFLKVALQCAQALVAAHEKNIIHCDLKPENIMLTTAGEVKILDFGVARELSLPAKDAATRSLDTAAGTLRGTPAYMAPEILFEHAADTRADIFSLGVVFYEALAGNHPFRAASFMATSDRVLHESPPPLHQVNPKVKEGISRVVMRMLAKNPAERFASAHALLDELTAAGEVITHPSLLPQQVSERKRPRWILSYLAVSLLALGIVVVAMLVWRRNPDGARTMPSSGDLPPNKQLAVLPFDAVGGSPETAAFGEGLAETLTAKLGQLSAGKTVEVIPAGEIRTEHIKTAEEARREFGVNLVLEGGLQRSGQLVRVTFSLVDARTKRQLRAGTVTSASSDTFAVEDQVVESVAEMLALEVSSSQRIALASRGTQVVSAYDLYLQGRGYLQDFHKAENIESAITVFSHALALDPKFALGYAGLGEAYWSRYVDTNDAAWVAKARGACKRAERLDPKLASAQICLGILDNGTGLYERAATEFQHALTRDPDSDEAYRGLAHAEQLLGKPEEAERTYLRAIQLRPQSWAGYSWLGAFYYGEARYAEAAKMFAQVVALAPDSFRGYSNLGGVYAAMGRYADAIPNLEKSVAIRPSAYGYANLATTYFYLRRFAEEVHAIEQAVKLAPRDYELHGDLGDAYYYASGKRPLAAPAYRQAIELARERLKVNPQNASVLADVAVYHGMLGENDLALVSMRQALAFSPRDPFVLLKAALVNNQLGNRDEGLRWLEKAQIAGLSTALIRDDPRFDNLRAMPGFQKLRGPR